jgi:hypothetical protein
VDDLVSSSSSPIHIYKLDWLAPCDLLPDESCCSIGRSSIDHDDRHPVAGIVGAAQIGELGRDQVLLVEGRDHDGNLGPG